AVQRTRRKEASMSPVRRSAPPRRPGVLARQRARLPVDGRGWLLAWCAMLALVGVLAGSSAAAPARTWIVGATVLSPERQDTGQVLHVRLDDDRIAAVTATLPAEAGQDATIVHVEGHYLIPGLIDAHV